MALRPSSIPLRAPLPPPPESSLPAVPDFESNLARVATAVPHLVAMLLAPEGDPDAPDIPTPRSYAEAITVPPPGANIVDGMWIFRSRPALPVRAVRTGSRVPRPRPPLVPGTHIMALRPSSIPLRAPLPPPPESSLPAVPDFESNLARVATAVPHLVAMLLAPEGEPDAPDIPTPRSYAEAITVPPPGANIVDGMWIFRVKKLPGSPPVFKTRYVARGFSQRQGFDFFHTFPPTPKMTTLRVLLHVAAQRDYELHSLDFSTAFLQGYLQKEIWMRRPPGFTGSFPAGT
ncbi:unnamed protein product [Closterium sp. NIES-53]